MPTDIVVALVRKVEAERQARAQRDELTVVCLWGTLGLVLTALMFNLGFGPALAGVVAIGG